MFRVPTTAVGRWRLGLVLVSLAALAIKLDIAASTFGTDDVHTWILFARTVRAHGPVGIYGETLPGGALYNHAPLSGWMLVLINWLHGHGLGGLPFLIRVPASVADCVTAVLVFELLRHRRGPGRAALAGMLVVLSPILLVISGFHGNTDPVMIMFCLLAVYLLVAHHSVPGAFAAGLAFGLGQSVKIVAVVLLPVLLVLAWREGRQRFAAFVAGGATVALLLWAPVVATQWSGFSEDVLGYAGVELRQWGLPQFFQWLEFPPEWTQSLVEPGRFISLIVAAGLPAVLLWWRKEATEVAVGLALVLFLLLSPAFGAQYLVWSLAGAYLVHLGAATFYNVAGSVFLLVTYSRWSEAFPWKWNEAVAAVLGMREMTLLVVTWLALALVAYLGVRMMVNNSMSDKGLSPTAPEVVDDANITTMNPVPSTRHIVGAASG